MSLTPTCQNTSTRSACGPPQIGGSQNLRSACAVADQAVAEGAGRRAGWRWEAAHEWGQRRKARHAARRGSYSPYAKDNFCGRSPEHCWARWCDVIFSDIMMHITWFRIAVAAGMIENQARHQLRQQVARL